MTTGSRPRGAQFSPAGVLLLPLDGQNGAGEILRYLAGKFAELKAPDLLVK